MSCYRFLIASFAISLWHTSAHAQLPQTQVTDPLPASPHQQEIKRQTERKVGSTEVLIPLLHGICIAPTSAAAISLQGKATPGISAPELSIEEQKQLQKKLQPWLGKAISLNTLDTIARAAERAISKNTDSLITASFPPQEITSGHIAMVIGVPFLHDISFAGNPIYGGDFLSRAVLTRPGVNASAESIRKDINFLNRNPFRKASALWSPAPANSPAANSPAANLIIHIKEKRPWSIYTGLDNHASDALGDERLYLGGKFGNVFDRDHRLGWILLNSADGNSLHAANLTYEIPLPRHHLLQLSAAYSESESFSPNALLDNNGRFLNFRAMLQTPLSDWYGLRHSWKSGFSMRNNLYIQGATETDITMFQFENLWEGEYHDAHGFTSFTAGLFWNPGDTYFSSDDATYAFLGADDAESTVATIKAERILPFQNSGDLELRAEAQWANENLLSSDQFAAAGAQRLRGYDESSAFYDQALLLSAEWQFRRISLPSRMSLSPHLFFDTAWLADYLGGNEHLSSLGAGFKWTFQTHYAAKLEIAQPLQRIGNAAREPALIFSFNTFW